MRKAIYCTYELFDNQGTTSIIGLTQQDLADYTGLSLRIIKSIEAGKGNPSVATLLKIAEVLGLELQLKVKEVVK